MAPVALCSWGAPYGCAVVMLPTIGSALSPLQRDWVQAQREDVLIASMLPPDALQPEATPEQNDAIMRRIWTPDHTMTARVRHSFGIWLSRRSLTSATPLKGDLADKRQRYDYYTGQDLAELSRDVGDPDKYLAKNFITRLFIHVAGDVMLCAPTVRRHLDGFVSVLKAVGGAQKAVTDKHIHPVSMGLMIITIFMTNTTSASHDQMTCESHFTPIDLYMLYSDTLVWILPCPRPLFFCIQHINQLRRRIAAGAADAGGGLPIPHAAPAIFDTIQSFQPDEWGGPPSLPAPDICATLAVLFQRAVLLYGYMTLAVHAGVPFDAAQRVAAAEAVMDAVRPAVIKLGHHYGLVWPVVVAGAALGGADTSLQSRLDGVLLSLCDHLNTSDGAFRGLQCLRKFWASGKTEWDECFSTWQATVP